MDARPLAICIPALIAIAIGAAGCGSTEKSGRVGDTLSAKGLQSTVEQVDTRVPVPESDLTGPLTTCPGVQAGRRAGSRVQRSRWCHRALRLRSRSRLGRRRDAEVRGTKLR